MTTSLRQIRPIVAQANRSLTVSLAAALGIAPGGDLPAIAPGKRDTVAGGSVLLDDGGDFTYSPPPDFTGDDSFTVDLANDAEPGPLVVALRVVGEDDAGAGERRMLTTSPEFGGWIVEVQAALAFTTYQTGRLFCLGLRNSGALWAQERYFQSCLGLWTDGDTIWLATQYQLWRLRNMASPGETRGDGADRVFVPRTAYVTGAVGAHDVAVDAEDRPIFVNTLYGCLATVCEDGAASFVPLWKPKFLSALVPEDRCHLNGLAMEDGRPRFVTAASRSDVADGWRDRRADGGVVLDVDSNEIVADGLSMPHSPRLHGGKLWLLNSGTGEFGVVDPADGNFQPVCFCPGYARGLAFVGDYAVIGHSRPRTDRSFDGLALGDRLAGNGAEVSCGLLIVDLRTGTESHWLRFEHAIDELYDVAVLPGVRQPAVIGFRSDAEIGGAVTVGSSQAGISP